MKRSIFQFEINCPAWIKAVPGIAIIAIGCFFFVQEWSLLRSLEYPFHVDVVLIALPSSMALLGLVTILLPYCHRSNLFCGITMILIGVFIASGLGTRYIANVWIPRNTAEPGPSMQEERMHEVRRLRKEQAKVTDLPPLEQTRRAIKQQEIDSEQEN